MPLRRVYAIVNGGTPTPDEDNWDGDVAWATPVDLATHNGRRIGVTARTLTARGLETGSRLVPPGSLILSTRAPIGYVVETEVPMAFNQGCRGLVPRLPVDARFFRYQLLALTDELQSRGQGSTFVELSTDALGSMPVEVVGLSAQSAIADYLDAETARIDLLVSLRGQGDAALAELWRATVDDAFDSDLTTAWRLKHLLAQSPCYGVLVPRFADGGVPFVRVGDIDAVARGWSPELSIEPTLADEYARTTLQTGDLVLSVVGSIDKVAVVSSDLEGANVARAVCRLVPREGVPSDLLALWLRSSAYLSQAIAATGADSAQPTLGMGDLSNFTVRFPRREQIDAFRERVQVRLAQVDGLRAASRRHATLLLERRQALISAAVTGQLEIPGVAA